MTSYKVPIQHMGKVYQRALIPCYTYIFVKIEKLYWRVVCKNGVYKTDVINWPNMAKGDVVMWTEQDQIRAGMIVSNGIKYDDDRPYAEVLQHTTIPQIVVRVELDRILPEG